MSDPSILAADVLELLQVRYSPPEWAPFCELRDAPGFGRSRTIDFFAAQTWPSRGRHYVAVEVKVSRADWLRELRDPAKRAPFEAASSEIWVAAPGGVVKVSELPEGMGLLQVVGKPPHRKLRRAAQAVFRADRLPDEAMWHMILRSAREQIEACRRQYEGPNFAQVQGRDMSYSEFRRFAQKLGARETFRALENLEWELARSEKLRTERQDWFRKWQGVVRQAQALANACSAERRWDMAPELVEQSVAALTESIKAQDIAARLRIAADILDPPEAPKLETT